MMDKLVKRANGAKFGFFGAVVLLAVVLWCASVPSFHDLALAQPAPAPDFELVNQDEQTVRLADYRGQIVLVYFGFTNCKRSCVMTLGAWQQVARALGSDADKVRFVFVSIDPVRDTPERLKEYLSKVNPAFIGLNGSNDAVEDLAQGYLAYFPEAQADTIVDLELDDASPAYLVMKKALTYVLDQRGRVTLAYRLNADPQAMAADIRRLLK